MLNLRVCLRVSVCVCVRARTVRSDSLVLPPTSMTGREIQRPLPSDKSQAEFYVCKAAMQSKPLSTLPTSLLI